MGTKSSRERLRHPLREIVKWGGPIVTLLMVVVLVVPGGWLARIIRPDHVMYVVFTLWIAAVGTASAWRAEFLARRRAREGACPACGYDRAGLAAGAVCPECGAAPSV